MKPFGITLLIAAISSIAYLGFINVKSYNSPENIEKRCTLKFQKDVKKGAGKSDKEWDLNMDIADGNYLECMGIP